MKKKIHSFEPYRTKLAPALQSKCEEFILLGFKEVSPSELWNYLLAKKWKKKENKMLHELVNDIMSVNISDYMHFERMETFKDSQKKDAPDLGSFKDLFV